MNKVLNEHDDWVLARKGSAQPQDAEVTVWVGKTFMRFPIPTGLHAEIRVDPDAREVRLLSELPTTEHPDLTREENAQRNRITW